MKNNELSHIRDRDSDFGDTLPSHWQAQLDRRNLLQLLDAAMEEVDELQRSISDN